MVSFLRERQTQEEGISWIKAENQTNYNLNAIFFLLVARPSQSGSKQRTAQNCSTNQVIMWPSFPRIAQSWCKLWLTGYQMTSIPINQSLSRPHEKSKVNFSSVKKKKIVRYFQWPVSTSSILNRKPSNSISSSFLDSTPAPIHAPGWKRLWRNLVSCLEHTTNYQRGVGSNVRWEKVIILLRFFT